MRILLSIIGCMLAIGAAAQEVEQQRYIKLTYVPDKSYVEQAVRTIEAVSVIPSKTTVEYRAGQSVVLQPGFEVKTGAAFTAHIKPVSDASLRLAAFPNPFEQTTTFQYDLPEAGTVNLYVVDAQGHVVGKLLENSYQSAGRHEIEWGPAALASGVYMPVLQTKNQRISSRVVKK